MEVNKKGMGYSAHIEASEFWQQIDEKKKSNITLPSSIEFTSIITVLPYYIKSVEYLGNNEDIIKHLNLQYEKLSTGLWQRSKTFLSFVVTTQCNLACNNCNLFSQYKGLWTKFSYEHLEDFITKYAKHTHKNGGDGATVKVTGGEPAVLGSKLDYILKRLGSEGFKIILLTNGILKYKPPFEIAIEDSAKQVGIIPDFHTTVEAPIDLPEFANFTPEDYSVGCSSAKVCGPCYSEGNLYPCAVAINIHKVKGIDCTITDLHDEEEKRAVYANICKYCGLFKKQGYHNLDKSVYTRTENEVISESWSELKNIKR